MVYATNDLHAFLTNIVNIVAAKAIREPQNNLGLIE
jgi:hypothetical protein